MNPEQLLNDCCGTTCDKTHAIKQLKELAREHLTLQQKYQALQSVLADAPTQHMSRGKVMLPRRIWHAMVQETADWRIRAINAEARLKANNASEPVTDHPRVRFIGHQAATGFYNHGGFLIGEIYTVDPSRLHITPGGTTQDPYTAPEFGVIDIAGGVVMEEMAAFEPVNDAARALYQEAGLA